MRPLPFFKFHSPSTESEAIELMNTLDNAKVFTGGTDLLPQIRERALIPNNLVSLNNVIELNYIKADKGVISIGSSTRLGQIITSPIIKKKLPSLYDATSKMGSPQIRNMATITGNLCNASPAADSAPPLYVHMADIVLKSVNNTRVIPINELFKGPKINSLDPKELVTEIRIPIPPKNSASAFLRIGRRKAFTLSVVSGAAFVEMNDKKCVDIKVALGSVAPTPLRLHELEKELVNKEISDELIQKITLKDSKNIKPITDIRGTAEYRKDMCSVLIKGTLCKSLERVREF
jgi:carbon-monoxide dehydrogenase medium subunit